MVATLEELITVESGHRDALAKLGMGMDKDVNHLALQYIEGQKLIQTTKRMPGENASAADVAKFHQETFGTPTDVEGYTVVASPNAPGVSEQLAALRDVALSGHIPKDVYERFCNTAIERATAIRTEAQKVLAAKVTADKATLNTEWGANAEKNWALVERGYKDATGGNEELKAKLDAIGASTDPAFVKMLLAAATMAADDTLPTDEGGGKPKMDLTLADAKTKAMRVRQILLTTEFNNKRDPKHEIIFEEYYVLQKALAEAGYAGGSDKQLQPDQGLAP
jgi:hypothetical protein